MNKSRITVSLSAEALRGGEVTEFGTVDYITCETDGVDIVFTSGDCSHFNYGETLIVSDWTSK